MNSPVEYKTGNGVSTHHLFSHISLFSSLAPFLKMEISVTSIVFSFVFAALLASVWSFLDWIWLKPKKLEMLLRQEGFSGNSYKLLHGDTKEMFMVSEQAKIRPINPISHDIAQRILPFHHRIITNYGKNSFIWLGPTPSINITDPKLIREIMLRYEIFQKPKRSPLGKLVFNGMLMYEGEQWFRVRKTANPAFHLDKLKNMLPKIYLSCNEMIRKWKSSIANEESCELDVWPDIKTLTADVISQTAFGSSFEDGRKIFKLLTEQISLLNQVFYFFHIPGWRLICLFSGFCPLKANRKLKSNNIDIIELIKGIINKREEALKVGEASSDDLLGLLVESNHREIQEHGNKETGMSIEEVIEECKLFYLAGQETTASLIVWTMILLCMHQNWQERAREEVFQVFGNKEPPFDELNRLKEVNKILHEALRLYPPAALFTRATMMELKLGEMKIPPGVLIALPIILVHQDEEYWGADAKEFNPDRFSQGVSKASKNDQVSFFPFGWGPRICIGQNFALLEAKLALTKIVQNLSFQLSPTYVHAPARAATIQPQHGAHMILRKI
ncbi:hypothetical protein Patl1_04985 [Pistacia atlantica]|uniref:Uncharacterized protein n=1 Tax=Pistacia atlantica TaxID=434234 RepID=A0ACC1BPK8_9ROSI|nr:hypothetical protein Patl1_04985 [Pistacia atlantica]